MTTPMIPCSEKDYLEQDPAVRGQNYACISFLSPEDILKDKEIFLFGKFLGTFSDQMTVLLEGIEKRYPEHADGINMIRENVKYIFDDRCLQEEFTSFKKNSPQLETEFHEANNFRTSVRGIKVRGSYETLDEARSRCDALKRADGDKHNIYIAQVGCWCPWDPAPETIDKESYCETKLNTLMKKYMDNNEEKEEFFNERANYMKKRAEESGQANKDLPPVTMEVIEDDDEEQISTKVEEFTIA